MDRYEWTVGEHLMIEVLREDKLIIGTDGKRRVGPGFLEPFVAEELLRLAEENKRLREQVLLGIGYEAHSEIMAAEVDRLSRELVEARRQPEDGGVITLGPYARRGTAEVEFLDNGTVTVRAFPEERREHAREPIGEHQED